MKKVKAWIKAFRLQSLSLSVSGVILGTFLAYNDGYFSAEVLISALFTTLFLQTLSNLANDYGDTLKGVDNEKRLGPKRGLQTGEISLQQMKAAIIILVFLSLFSGTWLIVAGTKGFSLKIILSFFSLGILAIIAAIKYTIGKKPYGYAGFGDAAVFIFFGLTSVLGTYFLHSHQLPMSEILPAASMGLFATGVLNINNLRDYENDQKHFKKSMVVAMGVPSAKIYHALLLILALAFALIYTFLNFKSGYQFLFLATFPLFFFNIRKVFKTEQLEKLDPDLKKLALSSLLFVITFGIGLIL
ncbi:MAG: 1,4-dihydroxy-2-naphthoate polyprenyltransferase [Ginsengibacter sp.]